MIRDKNLFIMCIQETKLVVCDDFLCVSLWGNSPHDFSFRPSVRGVGGIVSFVG